MSNINKKGLHGLIEEMPDDFIWEALPYHECK